jgi:hypothetical protein
MMLSVRQGEKKGKGDGVSAKEFEDAAAGVATLRRSGRTVLVRILKPAR